LSNLNEYERIIAQDVIDPTDMNTTFADVGGIDTIKMELWELVVFPLIRPDLFTSESGLVSPPKGILLCTFVLLFYLCCTLVHISFQM
jgi:ATP-dependent 26S proteasome regulatory subunit